MTEINEKSLPWIGFDLGGTKMLALVLDDELKIIGREKKKTRDQNENSVSIDRISKVIRTALENSKLPVDKIAGIGIGVPGTLDLNRGFILEAPNLGWRQVNLKELLEKEFSCPVAICNDVDGGIFGEYKLGAAQGANCALGIFPGTGIGGGMVYKGLLFTGKTNSTLEIGHFPVIPNGIRCGCGRYGCLETVASRLAISSAAAAAVYRGEAPALKKLAGTDISNIKSGTLAEAIKAGDTVIEEIIINATQYLGRTLGGVINLLAPDTIILGGGLIEAMPSLFLNNITQSTQAHVMPTYANTYTIQTASLGDDATALGAAAWAKTISRNN
jgi:glucokinase